MEGPAPSPEARSTQAAEDARIDIALTNGRRMTIPASLPPSQLMVLIEAHVRAAARLHGDDTTVPLFARAGTKTAWLWTYVRDDRPFDGKAPPSPTRPSNGSMPCSRSSAASKASSRRCGFRSADSCRHPWLQTSSASCGANARCVA